MVPHFSNCSGVVFRTEEIISYYIMKRTEPCGIPSENYAKKFSQYLLTTGGWLTIMNIVQVEVNLMNTIVTSKEQILETSRELIRQQGWTAVNIRTVAAA